MKTNQTPKKSIKAMPIEKKKWVKPKMERITLKSGLLINTIEDLNYSPSGEPP